MNNKTERKKKSLLKKILLTLGIILLIPIVFTVCTYCYLKSFYTKPARVDKEGKLYYTEYTGDYESPFVTVPFSKIKPVKKTGCSAFYTQNPEGEYDTCRNYDLAHLDDSGKETGLNVIVKCSPKNGYKSLAIADAAMFSNLGIKYYKGCLDDGKTSTVLLAFLPYICVDGINEKGLVVTIHALDLKDGEEAVYQTDENKEAVIITELLRHILDNCATVEEAEALAKDRNLINTFGADFHIFVTDASGKSAVFEWRYNTLTVTYTDIITNFYVNYDDAEDCYIDGALKETYIAPDENAKGYKFGYGHGFERFKTLMKVTEEHAGENGTVMDENEMMDALQAVSQVYTGELTSLTQYSVIYHNNSPGMDICSFPDYTNTYHFDLN